MNRWENYLPLLENAQLRILEYGLHRHTQFAAYNRVFGFYGVSYMSKGSSLVRFENESFPLEAGDAFLIPPNMRHDHIKTGKGEAEFLWWNFRFDVAGCVDALYPFRLPHRIHLKDQEKFASLFIEYMRLMEHPQSPSDILMRQSRAMELVAILLSVAFESAEYSIADESADVIPAMVRDIRIHCSERAILPLLSQKYNLHPTYLSNRFSQVMGISPAQLQARFRLERAKELLLAGSQSIKEIAETLGYESSNNFTRFFKAEEGSTPTQFQRLHRQHDL